MHFAQEQIQRQSSVTRAGFIETLHIKTTICVRIQIPKDRLAVFTNYPSVTNHQALEETVFTLFHPVVYGCFQPIGVITVLLRI